jgi:transcriptional regulator with XRE-family HTH domain
VTVTYEPNPTAARRELALAFRNLREQRGISLDQLAKHLKVTEVQASRLDRGIRGLGPKDVRSLAEWYGIPAAEQERLLTLVADGRRRAWWQSREIPDEAYRTLIGMEQAARFIGEYGSGVIPGLLQTRGYAHASAAGSGLNLTDEQIEAAVAIRMRRQQILQRDRPPRLWVVIDEAVLARVTGGPQVMGEQLLHLVTTGELASVTVQVIAFEYGAHPGGNSTFILVDTGHGLPDLVYVEGLRGKAEFTSEADTQRYREAWETLTAIALDPRQSRERIEWYIERLASDSRQGGEYFQGGRTRQ